MISPNALLAIAAEILLLVVGCLAEPAAAHDRFHAARLDSGLAIVPFAVPVATPVAVVQSGAVHYAYVPPVANRNDEAIGDAKLRAEFEAFQRWRQSRRGVQANTHAAVEPEVELSNENPPKSPLIAAHCLKCHAGAQAKGSVRLDGLLDDSVSNAQRLAAIRAVLTGSMPKGKQLESNVLGELLLELSQASSTSSVQGE